MSRLLFQPDGVTISMQIGPNYPPNHVLLVCGAQVAALNVSLALPDRSGLPRIDYEWTLAVIPPHATEERAVAIFRAEWRDGQHTVGGSYDDAGIGALMNKTAILYGIDDKTNFMNWYAQNYLGTHLVFKAMP